MSPGAPDPALLPVRLWVKVWPHAPTWLLKAVWFFCKSCFLTQISSSRICPGLGPPHRKGLWLPLSFPPTRRSSQGFSAACFCLLSEGMGPTWLGTHPLRCLDGPHIGWIVSFRGRDQGQAHRERRMPQETEQEPCCLRSVPHHTWDPHCADHTDLTSQINTPGPSGAPDLMQPTLPLTVPHSVLCRHCPSRKKQLCFLSGDFGASRVLWGPSAGPGSLTHPGPCCSGAESPDEVAFQ